MWATRSYPDLLALCLRNSKHFECWNRFPFSHVWKCSKIIKKVPKDLTKPKWIKGISTIWSNYCYCNSSADFYCWLYQYEQTDVKRNFIFLLASPSCWADLPNKCKEPAGRRKAEWQEKGQDQGIKQSRPHCTDRMTAKQSAHCLRQTPPSSALCRPHSHLIHCPPFIQNYEERILLLVTPETQNG